MSPAKIKKDWATIEAALPAYLRNVISPSELTEADDKGRRIIFSANPHAELINRKFGIMLLILKVIQDYIDPETFELEIISDPDFRQAWKTLMEAFPGTAYLGTDLSSQEEMKEESNA